MAGWAWCFLFAAAVLAAHALPLDTLYSKPPDEDKTPIKDEIVPVEPAEPPKQEEPADLEEAAIPEADDEVISQMSI
jgi:hypothetical protein